MVIVVLCDEANADMTKVLKDIGITPTEYDTIYDSVDWAGRCDRTSADFVQRQADEPSRCYGILKS